MIILTIVLFARTIKLSLKLFSINIVRALKSRLSVLKISDIMKLICTIKTVMHFVIVSIHLT